jgi:hypothetical protein
VDDGAFGINFGASKINVFDDRYNILWLIEGSVIYEDKVQLRI